jgi:hypothetical protein
MSPAWTSALKTVPEPGGEGGRRPFRVGVDSTGVGVDSTGPVAADSTAWPSLVGVGSKEQCPVG